METSCNNNVKKDVYLIAEVWDSPQRIAQYAKIFDSCFNFTIAQNIIEGVTYENTQTLQNNLPSIYNLYKNVNPQFVDAPFLTNHDMNRAYSEIGSSNKMKLAAALLLTLPGNPFIYYGEEIGMKEQKPDEYIRELFLFNTFILLLKPAAQAVCIQNIEGINYSDENQFLKILPHLLNS